MASQFDKIQFVPYNILKMETFQAMSSLSKQYENGYLQTLLLCLPSPYLHLDSNCSSQQQVVNIMQQVSEVNCPNE